MPAPTATRRVLAAVALCACLFATTARADRWALPVEKTVSSPANTARVTVRPRALSSQLDYFSDAGEGKASPGQAPGDVAKQATAKVEVRADDGTWRVRWEGPLANEVAPVDAVLADDGSVLVTLDHWHGTGYGDDVVVIYDGDGHVRHRRALDEVLPPAYVRHLMHSVSSIWWRDSDGAALVDGNRTLRVNVMPPGFDDEGDAAPRRVPLLIGIEDGKPLPAQGREWAAALRELASLEQGRTAAWQRHRAELARPLPAPATHASTAWRTYMERVRERLAWTAQAPVGGLMIPADGANGGCCDGPEDVAGMLRNFANAPQGAISRRVLFASPEGGTLGGLVADALESTAPGALAGFSIVVTATEPQLARARAAAARSGATVETLEQANVIAGIALPEAVPNFWVPAPGDE